MSTHNFDVGCMRPLNIRVAYVRPGDLLTYEDNSFLVLSVEYPVRSLSEKKLTGRLTWLGLGKNQPIRSIIFYSNTMLCPLVHQKWVEG
jgi:hypothetical protein